MVKILFGSMTLRQSNVAIKDVPENTRPVKISISLLGVFHCQVRFFGGYTTDWFKGKCTGKPHDLDGQIYGFL